MTPYVGPLPVAANGSMAASEPSASSLPTPTASEDANSGVIVVANSSSSLSGAATSKGGGKRSAVLKRVSFGSSKGSMVETLIYEHAEDGPPSTAVENGGPAKVRVTFYESQKPRHVTTPESPTEPLLTSSTPLISPPMANHLDRQMSTDSGVDNPFRPDGELSREAETIVSLIKEGKPISETDGHIPNATTPDEEQPLVKETKSTSQTSAPPAATTKVDSKVNGTAPLKSETVEVQHGVVVPPSDSSQVEQVVIKKKPKCKCCVIQ